MNLELDLEQVKELVSSSPFSDAGRFNMFFKVNDQIGLKLSISKKIRDGNYSRQLECAELGLGPDTFGIIDNVIIDGKEYYGYFTEIVQTYKEYEESISTEENYEDLYEELIINRTSSIKEIRKVFSFYDCHAGNLGMKNGKVICIDFDDFQTEDEKLYDVDRAEYIAQPCY